MRRYAQGFSEELTLPESLRLVKILADWGVFELAIGGGEPLEFPLLPAIVKEARRQGLVVHVTTGRHDVPAAQLAELAEGLTGLQIGVKADRLLANPSTEAAVLARTAAAAAQAGLHVGANLILSKQTLPHFEKLIELLQHSGLTNVTLLRYKPPADVAEWRRAKPPVKALREFESRLPEVLRELPPVLHPRGLSGHGLRFVCREGPLRRLHAAVWRWPEAGDRGVACLRLSAELRHRTQAVRHLPGSGGRRDWRHPGFDWIHSRGLPVCFAGRACRLDWGRS